MRPRRLAVALAALSALLAIGFGLALLDARQTEPRDNDRVLRESRSPDGVLDAFLVMRRGDSLSADVLKAFVAPAGGPWSEGEMVLLGRRFSEMGNFYWPDSDLLCLAASDDGIEEQENRASVAGRGVRFIVKPMADECFGA